MADDSTTSTATLPAALPSPFVTLDSSTLAIPSITASLDAAIFLPAPAITTDSNGLTVATATPDPHAASSGAGSAPSGDGLSPIVIITIAISAAVFVLVGLTLGVYCWVRRGGSRTHAGQRSMSRRAIHTEHKSTLPTSKDEYEAENVKRFEKDGNEGAEFDVYFEKDGVEMFEKDGIEIRASRLAAMEKELGLRPLSDPETAYSVSRYSESLTSLEPAYSPPPTYR